MLDILDPLIVQVNVGSNLLQEVSKLLSIFVFASILFE